MRFAASALVLCACGPSRPQLDVQPLAVVTTAPPDGASGVPASAHLTVCFNSSPRPDSATPATVALNRMDGHRSQATQSSLSVEGSCLIVAPNAPLAPASTYQLELRKGLVSAAGVTLAAKSGKAGAFSLSFRTAEEPAEATLVVPADGTLTAPLDLAQVRVDFNRPLGLPDGGSAFSLSPGGTSARLAADGRSASGPFAGGASGTSFVLTLSATLQDDTGTAPSTEGPLGFTVGNCAEGTAPGVGDGIAMPRDRDALLVFSVDRPGTCSASLRDPACPSAAAIEVPAQCGVAYDPCQPGLLCSCAVPLIDLCPGDAVTAIPQMVGFDGLGSEAAPVAFSLQAALPRVVLTEVLGGSRSTAFVEVQNRSPVAVDLLGFSLADCTGSRGCAFPKSAQPLEAFGGRGPTQLQSGDYALIVDPTFASGTFPTGAILLSPQGQLPLFKLQTTKPQALGLFSPSSATPLSTYDGSLFPAPGRSFERVDPGAADPEPANWSLSRGTGTPGACNSVTPGALCDPAAF